MTIANVPTMHPYSVGGGMQRRTLEADDIASLSELYPEATFSTFGTISGTVTRCERRPGARRQRPRDQRREPGDPAHAVTGFDGKTTGATR